MKHNWEYKNLGEVCEIKTGKLDANAKVENGLYPFFTCDAKPYRIDTFAFDTEAILISGNGSNVGHVHYYNGKFNAYQRTYVLSNIRHFNPHYLVAFLKGFLRPYIYNKKKGGCIPFITLPMLTNFPIPVPPMDMQERIVGELDKINEVMKDCRELLRNLDSLAQSLFYTYFGDPITNPKAWEVKTIQSITKTTAGGTPAKSHPEYYINGKIPWLRSGEVCKMNIEDTELRITELGMQNSSAKLVPINSVVIAMYGATAAQVGIIRKDMTLNQAICAILPNNFTSPIYLYFCLSSLKNSLLKVAHGAAQPNISQAIIKTTQIPVPPHPLQEKFAKDIEAIEAVKATTSQQLAELQTLLDSRMDYWFN